MNAYFSYMDKVGETILEHIDPKNEYSGYTKGWPLTDFSTAITIALGYLLLIVVGTAVMKHGVDAIDPYPIKFIYNVSQIMACSYMCIEAFLLAYRAGYTVLPGNPYNASEPRIANLLWIFYASKIFDFWDTTFIILGKKWRQLSLLHVYHHFTIFLFYWVNINCCYDADIYLTVFLNGFIHTVMYTYYFICMHNKDPETGKSIPIWWKSSLTMLQMIQFLCMMSQSSYLLITGSKSASKRLLSLYLAYIFSLLLLFGQFYVSSYTKKPKKKVV